jgi:tetratricopeptide (TPR) repeat protein
MTGYSFETNLKNFYDRIANSANVLDAVDKPNDHCCQYDKDDKVKNFEQSSNDITIAEYYYQQREYFSALQLYKKAFKRSPELLNRYESKFNDALAKYKDSL